MWGYVILTCTVALAAFAAWVGSLMIKKDKFGEKFLLWFSAILWIGALVVTIYLVSEIGRLSAIAFFILVVFVPFWLSLFLDGETTRQYLLTDTNTDNSLRELRFDVT